MQPTIRALQLELWRPLLDAPFLADLTRRLTSLEGKFSVHGLVEGARAAALTLATARSARPVLLVVPDDTAAEAWLRDLNAFAALIGRDPGRVVLFPALDCDPYDAIAPHPEVVRERVVALGQLVRERAEFLVVPARALLQWLPGRDEWVAWNYTLREGDLLPPDRFIGQLLDLGYRRMETVGAAGEVSRRGGIIDVFPCDAAEPIRIEWFGDTIESLRAFDTENQRSTIRLEEAEIGPAVESPPTEGALRRLASFLEAGRDAAGNDAAAVREYRGRLDQLQQAGYWPGLEALASLSAKRPSLVFDYARNYALCVDEPERVSQELERAAHEWTLAYEQNDDTILPPPARLFADPEQIGRRLDRAEVVLHELMSEDAAPAPGHVRVACRGAMSYSGRIAALVEDLRRWRAAGDRTILVLRAEGSADRVVEILREYGIEPIRIRDLESASGPVAGPFVGVGALRTGFELAESGLRVVTEREIFGEPQRTSDRPARGRGAFVSDFRDLAPGDLVVHVDNGVGRFLGLGRPKGGSLNRDFMLIEYAGGDRLFVPVDRLDLVQRYSGAGGESPALDKLGGMSWERVKSRVRKSVESMARELLDLYARRRAARGRPIAPDTPWQRELEEAFPFELTPDQERAVTETKADMESERVMDRLLVGDVGFGKTEVAVRAAFKAAMDGRQAALLAPTTVLCFQHFRTFAARFAPFPVRVEMVSRFRSVADVRRTLTDTALGTVDVLIGTHRMLSADVRFKDLGLLIVDEEQRFGVADKERLKRIAEGVDVLSMTATPIPRTLQMSLTGVRDLSVIETPPPGRSAIKTYLVPFRKNVVASAVRQELARGGQVFVVHNRIETLPALARAIAEAAPAARVLIAHGRLPEARLEATMLRFMRHEADVLVTTTIIENGLDIPRANTILVNRADRFGLAQLYQLRGRVGRSHQHAYCYFLIPDRRSLSEEAAKRLRALQEFSDLGAGFRLAAADLEIRGAGELLGSRQHGHIAALGFDLYCQLLERAVQELSGEAPRERMPPSLHLGIDIKIPTSFLPEERDRLMLYKRLAQARDAAQVDRLQAETEDRYGHLPAAAKNLFEMSRLRLLAEEAGVKAIDVAADKLQLRFHDRPPVEPERVIEILARQRGTLTPSGMLLLPAPGQSADRVRVTRELLERILGRAAAS